MGIKYCEDTKLRKALSAVGLEGLLAKNEKEIMLISFKRDFCFGNVRNQKIIEKGTLAEFFGVKTHITYGGFAIYHLVFRALTNETVGIEGSHELEFEIRNGELFARGVSDEKVSLADLIEVVKDSEIEGIVQQQYEMYYQYAISKNNYEVSRNGAAVAFGTIGGFLSFLGCGLMFATGTIAPVAWTIGGLAVTATTFLTTSKKYDETAKGKQNKSELNATYDYFKEKDRQACNG